MKHKLLVLFLILSFIGKGQNAYYDSKYIIDWLKKEHKDPNIEARRQVTVFNKLMLYTNPEALNGEERFFMVDSIFATFYKRNKANITLDKYMGLFDIDENNGTGRSIDEFIRESKVDAPVFEKIRKLVKRRKTHKEMISKYQVAIGSLTWIIADNQNKLKNISVDSPVKINNIIIPVYKATTTDTIRLWGRTFISKEELKNADSSFDNRARVLTQLKKSLEEGIEWMNNRPAAAYDKEAMGLFMELSPKSRRLIIEEIFKGRNSENYKPPFDKLPVLNLEVSQEQSDIRIISQQAQPVMQLSNFKMPSQAEVIDALAIYVAKRFKQEAIMYMVDQLKENMISDTLFSVMFPETRKLLFSQNAFSIPHFGTEWKYAISKDYILMPDHILSSDYMGSQFNSKSYKTMYDSWLIAKMIEKKYSYVEIMRNYATIEKKKLRTPMMKGFTQWSYMVNEELYTTLIPEVLGRERSDSLLEVATNTTSTEYWISPGTFNREMRPEQLSLMLAMMQQRYNYNVSGELGIDLSLPIEEQKQKLDVIKNWFSRNLLILNQFQKNQGKLFSKEVNDDEKSFFNGVSYWTFMNDIVASFMDTNVLKNKLYDGTQLQYVSNLNEIYSSFQNKNYPAAVSQLMGVIENLCSENTDFMLSQDMKVSYNEKSIPLNLSKAKLLNKLNVYSTYFSSATDSADMKAIRRKLMDDIDGVKTVMDDTHINYSHTELNKFTGELAAYDWRNIEQGKYLTTELARWKVVAQNPNIDYLFDDMTRTIDSSIYFIGKKYNDRLSSYNKCYCRSLTKAKNYANLLTDIMNSGTNSQNLSKVIEAHAAPVTSYKLKRYNRRTMDIGAYLGAYLGLETLPQSSGPSKAVYGLTVPIGFNYTWATLRTLDPKRVKYPYARRNDKVREFSGVSHSIGLSIIDIAAPVAYRLTNGSDGALPKNVKWSQMLSPGLHYRYGFKDAPICLSTGVQYTPQLRTLAAGTQLSAVRIYVGVLFDMPLFFISK
jgi:hypothetical protein